MAFRLPEKNDLLSTSIIMKEVDEQIECDAKRIKNDSLNGYSNGYSFKTKILKTDDLISNLSYPISLGLNYELDWNSYGSNSKNSYDEGDYQNRDSYHNDN